MFANYLVCYALCGVFFSPSFSCMSGSNVPTCTHRTWDTASATQQSCYEQGSLEGQRQMQLASTWQTRHQDTADQGHVLHVGIAEDNAVIYLMNDNTSGKGSTHTPAAYLLPHLCPQTTGWHRLMFNCASNTVSFFSPNNHFICYQLRMQ